jgi:H+-transporting ATPase
MSSAPSDSATGLTSDEARRRLATYGTNPIQDVVQHTISRASGKLWAPVPWMLEAAVLLQLALGEYVEASAVAFLLVFNAGLGFFQEGRAQATLEALKSRLSATASARRRRRMENVIGGRTGTGCRGQAVARRCRTRRCSID